MAQPPSLMSRLHADKIEPDELQSMLLDFYTRAQQFEDGSIAYGREEGVAALIVRLTKKGDVAGIEPGEAYKDEEIAALADLIQAQLIEEMPIAIGRRVLFAGQPAVGCFKYKDLFQLLPVPPEAPRPQFGIGGNPLLLEVSFRDTPALSIKLSRLRRATTEIELLCSALLGPSIYGEPYSMTFHWVVDFQNNVAHYGYCQSGYGWDGRKAIWDNAFSSLEGFPPFVLSDSQAYYTTNSIVAGENLALPATFEQSLDIYFGLEAADRECFLAACYWYQQGFRLWGISRSAAFVALVSSIEALTENGQSSTCEGCGKPTGAGPTQKFVDFIEKHVPDASATPTTRRQLYRVRSQITHGNKILLSDHAEWTGYLQSQEQGEIYRLSGTVRIALINWLLAQAKPASAAV